MSHPPYAASDLLASFGVLGPFERGRVLRAKVEVLALADELYLRHVRTPLLYQSGVRYVDSLDEWRDVPAVLAHNGDCKDLVAWRVAELRRQGVRAVPRIVWYTDSGVTGQQLYHVIVGLPGGRFEDPSRILGMP